MFKSSMIKIKYDFETDGTVRICLSPVILVCFMHVVILFYLRVSCNFERGNST
jgi:hypothetical protein